MATAQDITGMTGIRADLNAKGVGNDRIGFNKATGMVTIDGQDFIKPVTVQKGVSYADPNAYGQAYSAFDTAQKAKTAETNFMNAINNPAANPFDQQITDFLGQLTQRINNPTPYDVYSDPAYAAHQAQVDRSSQRGIRAAQEAFGASGFGRSTQLGERAQNIQNDANEYMQLQIVPQLRAANQAQQAQELNNLFNLFGALTGQQGVMDSRARNQTDMLAELLGYTTGRADRAQDVQYRTGRDAVQDNQWMQTFEENKRQYGEQFAYQKARDAIMDERDKRDFDEDVRRFGINEAMQRQQMRQSAANAAASNALARDNASFNRLMAIWEATGKAPAGIPGVAEGTPIGGKGAGMTQADMQKEASEMTSLIRSGQLTPAQALTQIDDDAAIGIYSPENAAFLRAQVQRISPQYSKPALTESELKQADPKMKTDREIEAEAIQKGLPVLDYKTWYKSPEGRLGGTDYETWKKLFGPRISAG